MPATARITQPARNLYLISLAPPLAGFEDFIGIWYYAGPPRVLVDVGPSATAGQLTAALDRIGARRLDYILLTHMHIDHGGGLGRIAAAFPGTPVVGHSRGLPHLADPARLWAGSLETLGATAEAYGPLTPVASDRLVAAQSFGEVRIQVIPTPGHASHHVSYGLSDLLFAGEAGGVCLSAGRERDYLRPATPPRFHLKTALASLDALVAANPVNICYSHFGLRTDAGRYLRAHREQLMHWQAVVADEVPRHPADMAEAACLARLLKEDRWLRAFHRFPGVVRRRERGFLLNSLRGFIGDRAAN